MWQDRNHLPEPKGDMSPGGTAEDSGRLGVSHLASVGGCAG